MPLPPGPTAHPLLQTLGFLLSPQGSTDRTAKTFGDLYTVRTVMFGAEVITSDPELIKQIFTGDPDVYHAGEGNESLAMLLGDRSLLILDGQEHLRERRLMMPALHGERMQAYAETMREVTERDVAAWEVNRPFSIHESLQQIALEVILTCVFGLTEGPRRDLLRDKLAELMNGAQSPIGILLLIPALQRDFGPLWPWRAFQKIKGEVDAIIHEEIAARRAELAGPDAARRTDILSMLICARYEDGQGMSDQDLRDELMTLLIAGHETTATALSWAFEQILANPRVHGLLVGEIDDAIAAGKSGPDDLTRLPYLDAVIKEVLRLRPAVPVVARRVTKPVVLRGYEIPAGTLVVPSIYVTHRRADLYPEPLSFQPERFLGKKTDLYSYLPFGGGTRRCLGMAFAMYEMKIVLATVLSRVMLRAMRPAPLKVVLRSFIYAPEGGTEVVVIAKR